MVIFSMKMQLKYKAGSISLTIKSPRIAIMRTDIGRMYEVRSDGAIFALNYRNTGKRVKCKQSSDAYGYAVLSVLLSKGYKAIPVHRIIATAFIPNQDGFQYVNHKDENKQNNKASNLEWCSAKYNINYGTRNERTSNARLAKKYARPIAQIKDGEILNIFYSFQQARAAGFDSAAIQKVARRVKHHVTHKGYEWKFCDTIPQLSHIHPLDGNKLTAYSLKQMKIGETKSFRCESRSHLNSTRQNFYYIKKHCLRTDGAEYKIEVSPHIQTVTVEVIQKQ